MGLEVQEAEPEPDDREVEELATLEYAIHGSGRIVTCPLRLPASLGDARQPPNLASEASHVRAQYCGPLRRHDHLTFCRLRGAQPAL